MRSLILLVLSLLASESECDLLRDSVHVTSAAARPNNELWCYKCLAEVPDDRCADLRHNNSALIHKCHNDRRMCMDYCVANKPDIVVVDRIEWCAMIIDITVPHDGNLVKAEKYQYLDLACEIVDMWDVDSAIIVPIVVTANGLIAKNLDEHLRRLSHKVKRFSFTTSTENSTTLPKMWALERNCTKHCEPGCIVIGERTKLYACTSCCTTSLCNYGSGSDENALDLLIMPFAVLLLSL